MIVFLMYDVRTSGCVYVLHMYMLKVAILETHYSRPSESVCNGGLMIM
jgi:hypothetical protein